MRSLLLPLMLATCGLLLPPSASGQTEPDPAQADSAQAYDRYTYVGSVERGDLNGVTSVAVSPDGEHLYAAAWRPATISRYDRDPLTGDLDHQQTITDSEVLGGAVALRLSPDGRHAVATAFNSQAVVLFRRDPASGVLERLGVVWNEDNVEMGLSWPIDAAFSPDGRFVYVIDSRGPGRTSDGEGGAVAIFRVTDDEELEWVATTEGVSNALANARGIDVGPDGDRIYVTSSGAGALTVFDRDEGTGAVEVRQVIRDGEGEAEGLAGAMSVAVSPDGRHVYVSSGRFGGDNAVSVFEEQPDGKLALVQEIFNGEGMEGFEGGNEILISPDGRNVFAAATGSGAVVNFRRDAATGRLTYLQTLDTATGGAAGLGVSPDGNVLYVAAENSGGIAIYAYSL